MIAKFILAGSVQIFNIGRRREVFADPVLPKGGSDDKVEGTAFEFYVETVSASALENRICASSIYTALAEAKSRADWNMSLFWPL